jgi:phosphate transport system substrate-binding protein
MKHTSRLVYIASILIFSAILVSACGQADEQPAASVQQPASSGQELKGNIAISGAFALYPMMTRWAEEFHKVHPGVEFDISAGGAGKGMADALAGAVDIGMVSRSVTKDEEGKGAFWVAVTKDAVFPMVNEKNPVLGDLLKKGVSRQVFMGIYISETIKTWGEVVGRPEVTDQIHLFTRSDSAGAPEVWAKYLGGKQENLKGIGVQGDPGLLEAVVKDPFGIGYNNLGYAFDMATGKPVAGAAVVPIDANGNGQADPDEVIDSEAKAVEMVATGKYPSPPARALNLVTKGKPSGLLQAFLTWIVTDGQKFVGEAGYVQLPPQQLQESLDKLK